MEFREIVNARYATRGFDGNPIPEEQVAELLEMIRMAPTSFNLQPWKIKVITDQETKDEIQPLAWNQSQVGSCSHLLVFCANTDLETLTDKLEKGLAEAGMPEKSLAGFVGMIRNFTAGLHGDARLAWSQKQTYIALANGMNGAKALGFDSCPMEGFEPAKVDELLGLPPHLLSTVLLPIGYANDTPRPKVRFSQEEMFF